MISSQIALRKLDQFLNKAGRASQKYQKLPFQELRASTGPLDV